MIFLAKLGKSAETENKIFLSISSDETGCSTSLLNERGSKLWKTELRKTELRKTELRKTELRKTELRKLKLIRTPKVRSELRKSKQSELRKICLEGPVSSPSAPYTLPCVHLWSFSISKTKTSCYSCGFENIFNEDRCVKFCKIKYSGSDY